MSMHLLQGFNTFEPYGHAPVLRPGDRKQGTSDMWRRQLAKPPAAARTGPPAPRGRTRDQVGVWATSAEISVSPPPSSVASPEQRCRGPHGRGALPTLGLSEWQTHMKGSIPTGPRPCARSVRCPHRSSCGSGAGASGYRKTYRVCTVLYLDLSRKHYRTRRTKITQGSGLDMRAESHKLPWSRQRTPNWCQE